MPLADSWTQGPSTTTSTTFATTAPRAQAVGKDVWVAVVTSSTVQAATMADNRGNTYTLVEATAAATYTHYLFRSRLTTSLLVGSTITMTLPASRNRFGMVVGVFDDVVNPLNSATNENSNTSATNTVGSTVAGVPVLIVSVVSGTSNAFPATATGGATKIAEVVTAAGSSDRGIAMAYEYEAASGSNHNASWSTSGGGVANTVTGTVVEYTPPPSGPDYTKLDYWNGTTLVTTVAALDYWDGTTMHTNVDWGTANV